MIGPVTSTVVAQSEAPVTAATNPKRPTTAIRTTCAVAITPASTNELPTVYRRTNAPAVTANPVAAAAVGSAPQPGGQTFGYETRTSRQRPPCELHARVSDSAPIGSGLLAPCATPNAAP